MTALPTPPTGSDAALDLALVERLRQANRVRSEVSRELFQRYWQRVLGFFRSRGCAPELAKDLTQETLLRVFQNMETYRGEAPLASWIFHIAENVLWTEIRRQKAVKRQTDEVSLGGPGSAALQIAVEIDSPEEDAAREEAASAVRLALTELSPQRQRCLDLHLQGCTHREIAEELGLTVGTVKAHLHQARGKLRRKLGKFFPDEGF